MNKTREYVGRLNGHSIYWNNRYSKKDANRFVIIQSRKQIYDTDDLFGVFNLIVGGKKQTSTVKNRMLKMADEFDKTSKSAIEKYL